MKAWQSSPPGGSVQTLVSARMPAAIALTCASSAWKLVGGLVAAAMHSSSKTCVSTSSQLMQPASAGSSRQGPAFRHLAITLFAISSRLMLRKAVQAYLIFQGLL